MNAQPENDNAPVRVIFRVWKDSGTVIALFPDIAADRRGNIQCYEHTGQHGAADYGHVIEKTRPATPEEYAPLQRELQRIGYNLTVRRRRSR